MNPPPDTSARNSNIISSAIDSLSALLEARQRLKSVREKIRALGPAEVLASAFAGANSHVGPADIPPALAALDALEAVLVDQETGEPTEHLRALIRFLRG